MDCAQKEETDLTHALAFEIKKQERRNDENGQQKA